MEPLHLADLTEAELAAIAGITVAELRARIASLHRYEDEQIDAAGRALLTAQEPHAPNPNTQAR
jgi:hypothetical protein